MKKKCFIYGEPLNRDSVFLEEKDFEDNKWEGPEKSYYDFFPKNIQSYYGKTLIINSI